MSIHLYWKILQHFWEAAVAQLQEQWTNNPKLRGLNSAAYGTRRKLLERQPQVFNNFVGENDSICQCCNFLALLFLGGCTTYKVDLIYALNLPKEPR
jgi:hypothetical protein